MDANRSEAFGGSSLYIPGELVPFKEAVVACFEREHLIAGPDIVSAGYDVAEDVVFYEALAFQIVVDVMVKKDCWLAYTCAAHFS